MTGSAPCERERGERALAHVLEVGQRVGVAEDLEVAADGARRLERVVERREVGAQQRRAPAWRCTSHRSS